MATERIDIVVTERGSRVVKRNLEEIGGGARTAHAGVDLLKRTLLTLGVGFTLNQAIGTLANFAQEMASVRAITGATEEQFKMLREETKRLGAETRFSASQAAEGAQFLARAGFDTAQIMASLEQTLTLAQAGALDLGRAADIASNVLTGFRISADEAGRVVDVLAFAANRGNTDVAQLGEAMKFVAPVASGLGVSLEEATAAVTALSDAGLQGSLAGTGLRRVLSTLEAPTDKVRRLLGQLGVNTEEVRVSQVGLTAALQRLRDAGVDTGLALEIFGDRGGPAFEVLSQAIPRVRELNGALEESEGFAKQVADVMDDNLNGALLSTRSAVEALIIAFGDLGAESALTTLFRNLATGIRFVANNLENLMDAVLVAMPLVIYAFRVQFVAALTAARGAVIALTAAIAANPVGFLLIAITAVVSALTLFRDEINLGIDDITTLGDIVTAFSNIVRETFGALWGAARDTFGPIIDLIGEWFGEFEFSTIGILRLAAGAVDGYVGLWRGAIDAVIELFMGLPAALGDLFTKALNVMLRQIGNFVNAAGRLLSTVTEFIGLGQIAAINLELESGYEGKAAELGRNVSDAFARGYSSSTMARDFLARLERDAQAIALERERSAADAGGPGDFSRGDPEEIVRSALASGATNELIDNLDRLLGKYNSVYAAQQEYGEALQILTEAERAGLITSEQKADVLKVIEEQLRDSLDPLGALNRELERERELLGLSAEAREVENQLRSIQQDLLRQGIILNEVELEQLREKLVLVQQETEAARLREQTLRAILGPQQTFIEQLQVINELVEEGAITREQALAQILQSERNLLEGTIEGQMILVAQYEETYARIEELRQADLISEQTANQMKARLDAELYAARMKNAGDFFGNLATLSRSGNRELAAIGKAAAVTQATIDGVLAVQKALASAPPPVNYALAASVGIATAANIANIMAQTPGFAFGGDFTVGGAGGTDSQLVAFRATPGETVSVRTPTQERDESRGDGTSGGAPGTSGAVRIVNVLDPALVGDYLNTDEGEELVMNIVQRNQRALGV